MKASFRQALSGAILVLKNHRATTPGHVSRERTRCRISPLTLLILLTLCFAFPAVAANYYVDTNSYGGDGTSTATSGTHAAFKTLAAAAAAVTGDQHGNSVLLNRGCVWKETYTNGAYGTAAGQFTIGAYGTGANPIINGADVIATWTSDGGNKYHKTVTTQPRFVIFDGVYGNPKANTAAMVADGDYYWASNVLNIYSSSDPAGRTIEGSQKASGIDRSGSPDYITVDNLDIRNFNAYGINNYGRKNWVIQNCSLSYIFTSGINLDSNTGGGYCAANYNTIDNVQGCGISFSGGNNIISYNTITNTGKMWDGITYPVSIQACYPGESDDGSSIHHNTIHDGYGTGLYYCHGIYICNDAITNMSVYNNNIYNMHSGAGIKFAASGNVHHNQIYNCYAGGVLLNDNMGNTVDVIIYYNVIFGGNNCINVIREGTGTFNLTLYNNVLYKPDTVIGGVNPTCINIYPAAISSLTIKNNIIYPNTNQYAIAMPTQGSFTISNNIYYQDEDLAQLFRYNDTDRNIAWWVANIETSGAITADPRLVNPTSDFHLKLTSPCIKAGVNVGLDKDFAGNDLPKETSPDIGPFQHVANNNNMIGVYMLLLGN